MTMKTLVTGVVLCTLIIASTSISIEQYNACKNDCLKDGKYKKNNDFQIAMLVISIFTMAALVMGKFFLRLY